MIMNRVWCTPNSKTFSIPDIGLLIHKYRLFPSIDPFARDSKLATITNDINPETSADFHLNALDFLKCQKDESYNTVLFDPPYSPRQVIECYKSIGKQVNMQTTQSSFWGNIKKEIKRILKPNGYCISLGWNSNGIGKNNGFDIVEILIVAHGGWHNDTICTVEKKVR